MVAFGVILSVGLGWFVVRHLAGAPKIRHVVLISIDTCRADFLSCYGYGMQTTPNIDALAEEGVLFENAISPIPFTLPAHCSMLAGTIPPYHGVMDNSDYILGKDNVTLAEILKEEGFNTGAFVSSFILDAQFGIGQGFDTYEDNFDDETSSTGINERIGGETTELALKWLKKNQDQKNFMFLHYYDPHFTYDAPEPFKSKFRNSRRLKNVTVDIATVLFDRYAGEIAYADHCIGKVIAKLKELGMYDSTMIIVTSDHGEMLGQHGEISHGFFIYQPVLKVPLVMKLPGGSGPLRVKNTVGLIDIVPTVCSALGIKADEAVQGVDLLDYTDKNFEGHTDRHLYCQSFESTKYGAHSLLGVVTDKYKYIQTTRPELYDLPADPGELKNLAEAQPNRGRIMQDRLHRIIDEFSRSDDDKAPETLDADTLSRLESLGYVGGGIEEDFSFQDDKEDPKDLVDYHVRMMEVGFYVYREQYETAREKCLTLIADRPSYFRPYFVLGKVASKQKKHQESADYLKKSIEQNPEHVQSYQGLAAAYDELGKPEEAVAQCVRILEIRPNHVEAYFKLSKHFYEKGDFDAPRKYQSADLLEHPSYVKAAISLAKKLVEEKQVRRSVASYKRILELEPDSVEVLNSLAWIQGASASDGISNPSEAVGLAKRACELTDYGEPEVLDTLAVAYAAAGDYTKAIEYAQKAIARAQAVNKTGLADRTSKRLGLYRNNRPYHDRSVTE